MTFSIIIVNYQTAALTVNCLNSLFNHGRAESLEIIVVDNFSNDGSAEILAKAFGRRIKLIKSEKNLGFAGANNLGAGSAQGEYLFFLNSDTIIKDNILPPLESALRENEKLGVLAPLLLDSSGQPQLFASGDFPRLSNLLFSRREDAQKFDQKFDQKFSSASANLNSAPDRFETDWVSGAALIIKKEIFKAVGGWDDKYFLYFEDVDLCRRVKRLGYSVGVCPQATVTHLGGRSLASQNWSRKKQYYTSQAYFFRKNYGRLSALALRFLRFPYKIWVWLNN